MSPESSKTGAPSIPPPLNIPPSRARRQLAARLARKQAEAAEADEDPDAADSLAVEAASHLPEDPSEGDDVDLGPAAEREIQEAGGGLQITGLRTVGGIGGTASRFSGLFGGSDDSSSSGEEDDEDFDENEAGRDATVGRPEGDYEGDSSGDLGRRRADKNRRPSTTEAKSRTPLDDEDDDEDVADLGQAVDAKLVLGREGVFADPTEDSSDEEDELVEIRPRRTS